MATRTTHRSSKGTRLCAVRDKNGRFEDTQTYKQSHGVESSARANERRKRSRLAAID
ncbi:MAG: hypothetical protein OJF51_004176 [Nitrospira sp.]|nr:MAG: hypothetical protein OJF51_004176 [Nitrospira sp.]